jgi:hypothetical protein
MPDRSIETSKQMASQRQIEAAILHHRNGAFECAITLAHAGENIASIPGIVSFFDRLKEKMFDTDHNLFANWLKHPSGPNTATISELEVVAMIQRGISKYNAVYGGVTVNMQNFMAGQRKKLGDPTNKA